MTSQARIKTNCLLAKAFDLNDFLDPTRLAHDELQYYNDLTRLFDKTISKYIDWLDTPEARKLFYEQIKAKEEYFTAIDKDIDDIIQDTSLSADRIIEKIYNKGLNYGYKDINRLPVFNDACKYGLKATQEYNFELITNVTEDLKESIKHHIFRGVAEGQSVHEVARAITDSGLQPLEGKTLSAYQRASLIARTEIARAMTTGRLQSYANYGVEKVKILTAGDDNVCPICREAEKKIYTLDQASGLVPFHPACRCSVIAHIEHYQDIPTKPIGDASIIACVPAKETRIKETFNKSAQKEFEDISDLKQIKCINFDGEEEIFTIECIKNVNHSFLRPMLNDEYCYKYNFKDKNGNVVVSIYKSKELKGKSVLELFEMYAKLPKKLTEECKKIILSNQSIIKGNTEIAGFVVKLVPNEVNILNTSAVQDMEYVLIHELGHSFNYSHGNLSKSRGYIESHEEDIRKSMRLTGNYDIYDEIHYISQHSCEKTNAARDNKKDDIYDEDFSECIYYLIHNQWWLHHQCGSIEEYLCGLLDIPIHKKVRLW